MDNISNEKFNVKKIRQPQKKQCGGSCCSGCSNEQNEKPNINLNYDPACSLGKSQVSKSSLSEFNVEVLNSVEKGLVFLENNPEFVKELEATFESRMSGKADLDKELAIREAMFEEFSG